MVTKTTKETVDEPEDTVASTDIETNTNTVVSSCPIPMVRHRRHTMAIIIIVTFGIHMNIRVLDQKRHQANKIMI